jgi:hypothetical protein
MVIFYIEVVIQMRRILNYVPGSTMPSKRFKMLGPFVIGSTADVIGAFQIIKWIGLYKGWVAAYWWPAFVAATRRQAAGGNH